MLLVLQTYFYLEKDFKKYPPRQRIPIQIPACTKCAFALSLSTQSFFFNQVQTSQFQNLRQKKSSSVYASKFAIYLMVYGKTKLLFPFYFSYFPANKWSMGIEYVDQAQGFHQGLKLFTGNYHQSSTNSEFGGLGLYKFVLLCKCDNKYRSGCFSLLLGKNGTIFAPSDNDDGIQPHQK